MTRKVSILNPVYNKKMKAIRIILSAIVVLVIAALAMYMIDKIMLKQLQDKNACREKVVIGNECELTYQNAYGYEVGYPFKYKTDGGLGAAKIDVKVLTINYIIWLAGTSLLLSSIYLLFRKLYNTTNHK